MDREHLEMEINAMHQLLAGTDYKAIQLTESLVSTMSDATALNFITKYLSWLHDAITDYGETIRQRAEWRRKLKEYEAALAAMGDEDESE
jgi:hypothetical protein